MALISFINKSTYDVIDELDDYIYCDYDLRYIIATLNKKGYETVYSCSGHNEVGLLEYTHREPISELEDFLKESKTNLSLHYIDKDDNYFYHKDEKVYTYTYIYFKDNYKFKNAPKDFTLEVLEDKSYISKKVTFYKDSRNTIRKTDNDIFKELEQNYLDLKEWVDDLEYINY